HPGVVHQDVQAAQVGDGLPDQRGGLLRVGHVGADGHRLAAAVLDRRDDGLGLLAPAAVVDRHVGAPLGQREGGGPADAPRRAGDQRHLTLQLHVHSSSSAQTSATYAIAMPVAWASEMSMFRRWRWAATVATCPYSRTTGRPPRALTTS